MGEERTAGPVLCALTLADLTEATEATGYRYRSYRSWTQAYWGLELRRPRCHLHGRAFATRSKAEEVTTLSPLSRCSFGVLQRRNIARRVASRPIH